MLFVLILGQLLTWGWVVAGGGGHKYEVSSDTHVVLSK